MATLPGGRLVMHFTNRKNAPLLFSTRIGTLPLTAEKVIASHRLSALVNEYVKQFKTRKRRKENVENWKADYQTLLGESLIKKHWGVVDQVVPQSAIFLSAIVFDEWVNILKKPLDDLLAQLEDKDYTILNTKIEQLIDFVKEKDKEAKSWPTLLKSQALFENVSSFLRGVAA